MHRGYNSHVNGTENKFLTYNGVELEESLDLNMYEMELRHYDPATARWIVQDPIVHFDYSPYQAFDNNPVFWADPSGGDSINGETVGADGLTNSQWLELSRPGGGGFDAMRAQSRENVEILAKRRRQASVEVGEGAFGAMEQDACPKCPDKEKRKLAIMMAGQYGGNAQDYYNKLVNPNEALANSISENLTNIALFGFIKGGKAKGKGGIGKNPNLLKGRSLAEIQKLHGSTKGWMSDVMRKSTTHPNGGWVLKEVTKKGNLTGRRIQYHPGTSRHFGGKPYWKVSDGSIVTRVPVGN